MSKYAFPAIFMKDGWLYRVTFPDLEDCSTCGDGLVDAIEMAKDELGMTLALMERDGTPIPEPSMNVVSEDLVTFILVNTLEYRKRFSEKPVRKTITIPEWLAIEADDREIDLSQTLQEALMRRLGFMKCL